MRQYSNNLCATAIAMKDFRNKKWLVLVMLLAMLTIPIWTHIIPYELNKFIS